MKYNFHDIENQRGQENEIIKWALIEMSVLAYGEDWPGDFDPTAIEIVTTYNGHEIDFMNILVRALGKYDQQVEAEAKKVVDSRLDELEFAVNDLILEFGHKVRATMRGEEL